MKLPPSCSVYALILSVGLFGQSAIGAVIVQPTGAVSATGNLSNRPIDEAINGNGLLGGGDILTQLHNGNGGNSGEYWIGNVAGAQLTFTLGGAFDVNEVHLWTYQRAGEGDRSISSFVIQFSTDGISFGDDITLSGWVSGQSNNNDIAVQSQSFATQSGVTHIRFSSIVNHGDGSFVGLSEVRFEAIPEPSALLLCGAGGLLLLRRRR